MDNWRRQKGDSYKQEFHRTGGSYNKRPPTGCWPTTVPSWEKKFCTLIGSIPWHKLLEIKKYMHLYDNIVQWNDSAGEESFNNAKYRFWAEMNGLPCDISLPGPDIYIDEIDWDSEIDPELMLDLERYPVASDHEEVTINSSLSLLNQPIPCTGWGDEEENQVKTTNSNSGLATCDKIFVNNDSPWESRYHQSNGGNMNANGWGNNWNQGNGGVHGWHMSRYKTSRFHGDDYQMDHGWRNKKWRKTVNHAYENKIPTARQWKTMNSRQPLNHGSDRNGHSWNWEKPVS